MVFSLFGRNKAASSAGEQKQSEPRSPSPSSASISEATRPPQTPEVLAADINAESKKSRSLSRGPAAVSSTEYSLPPSDPTDLLSLLKKVPPKTLHDYVLSHILDASPQEISSLLEFFKSLTPPPKLHCVRCHKDYVEVENTDRSYHVAHDDDSAEVEFVGKPGTKYETLYGCCNRVVEGDGDLGPPDGWCYEGFHTTDVKRARFRVDSEPQDDKLVSCKRMRCFSSDASMKGHGRGQRAGACKSFKEASDEEEDYDMYELEREAEILSGKAAAVGKGNKKKVMKTKQAEQGADESVSISAAKPKKKAKAESLKPRSTAKSTSSAADASTSLPSPRSEARATDDVVMVTSSPAQEPEVVSQPKKKRRARKSAAADGGKYQPPKADENSSDSEEELGKPRRKKTKRKSVAVNNDPSS